METASPAFTALAPADILGRDDLTANAKLVLLACHHLGVAHPSATQLAAATSLCRRTIIRVRQQLVADGLLPATRRHVPSGPGTVYAIHDRDVVKIGFTTSSATKRFAEYLPVRHLRERYQLRCSAPAFSMADEHAAHAALAADSHQSDSEWFTRTPRVEAYLRDTFGIDLVAADQLAAA